MHALLLSPDNFLGMQQQSLKERGEKTLIAASAHARDRRPSSSPLSFRPKSAWEKTGKWLCRKIHTRNSKGFSTVFLSRIYVGDER